MSHLKISNVKIAGITSCVPKMIEENKDLNMKIAGLRADEVRVVASNFVALFDRAMEDSEAELNAMREKVEQKRQRARES